MSIKKIAEMVGVSASTVSRVLADPKYRCASDTLREEIMEAARKLNYVPNEAAIKESVISVFLLPEQRKARRILFSMNY